MLGLGSLAQSTMLIFWGTHFGPGGRGKFKRNATPPPLPSPPFVDLLGLTNLVSFRQVKVLDKLGTLP